MCVSAFFWGSTNGNGIDQDTLDEFLDFVFEVMAAAVSDPFLSPNFDISFTDI